jgi:ribosomal protein S18 acetylase RimI-like enzyme
MIVEDWRDLDPRELAALYRSESARYRSALQWDLEPSCRIIEDARASGRLPGLVVRRGDGEIAGWTYFVVYEGILQIGALVAESASALRRLLDHVLQSTEASYCRSLTAFLYPSSPSLLAALERQRFMVERHPYLARPVACGPSAATVRKGLSPEFRLRLLGEVDPADVVRLSARSYAGMSEARCFAPDGRLDQWAHYLGQLLATPACGRYLPTASFAIERRDSRELAGAMVVTALAPETAHIAQIVVDPACRRAGLAAELVGASLAQVREDGYSVLSLIVAEANAPARGLYARLGFSETASFVFASRAALTRRTSQSRSESTDSWATA